MGGESKGALSVAKREEVSAQGDSASGGLDEKAAEAEPVQ
jgi:hypothetical protein